MLLRFFGRSGFRGDRDGDRPSESHGNSQLSEGAGEDSEPITGETVSLRHSFSTYN